MWRASPLVVVVVGVVDATREADGVVVDVVVDVASALKETCYSFYLDRHSC